MSAGVTPLLIHWGERPVPPWAAGAAMLEGSAMDDAGADAVQALADAPCVLVDATVPRFVELARAVHSLDASVQVIAVTPPAALTATRRALLYAPGLGEVWLASPAELGSALTERAAGVTHQRRRFERTRARMAREQLSESPQRTERALISDAYLAGLLRVLPDAVFSVDTLGRVRSANLAAERSFARTEDAGIVGALLGEALGLEGVAPGGEPALLAQAMRDGLVEVRFRYADGAAAVGELRAIPVGRAAQAGVADGHAEPADAATAWAVVLHDVTEQHAAHDQLRDNAMELEAQTEELQVTAEALAERTTDAERMREVAELARAAAEAASRAQSDFLATMSHEIRTPINAIVGYTQLLAMGIPGEVSEGQRAQLDRITGAARHLLGLVNDVLDVAKVEAGEMRVARERCEAEQVVGDALSLTRPLAYEAGIGVTYTCEVGGLAFVGDEGRVRQILVNLLSNALKFTPRGGLVTVTCGRTASAAAGAGVGEGGPWTYLAVRDTGIGIAPDQQAAVFEPFVQAESGHTRTKGGTGLGLTISRRLARLMGGDLTLDSTPGVGTTFTLWLPAIGAWREEDVGTSATHVDRVAPPGTAWRAQGLAKTGRELRAEIGAILDAYVQRLRADPELPRARDTSHAELEDHGLTLLAEFAQSFIILAEVGEDVPDFLRDGSVIQRAIAEQHGARRWAQGWTEAELLRDHKALHDAVERAVRSRVATHAGDVTEALRVLRHLTDQATATSVSSYRSAAAREAVRAELP